MGDHLKDEIRGYGETGETHPEDHHWQIPVGRRTLHTGRDTERGDRSQGHQRTPGRNRKTLYRASQSPPQRQSNPEEGNGRQ